MFKTTLKSGDAEIIDSNSVLSFVPDVKESRVKPKELIPAPIEVNISYFEDFLLKLIFQFDKNSYLKGSSWKSEANNDNKTITITITNLQNMNQKHTIDTLGTQELAKLEDGGKLYLSFSVKEISYGVNLTYTLFYVEGGKNES
ncbi:hypothetical protein [Halobacillus sp. KGW1]|uniref:hypothetical protein n=1 Tax=Halobacillus sp. KGW1 TaxID=1793726 RepID=UPI000785827C|nr:hypothetical protein [Halobacillus sp. KGW1]